VAAESGLRTEGDHRQVQVAAVVSQVRVIQTRVDRERAVVAMLGAMLSAPCVNAVLVGVTSGAAPGVLLGSDH
jgi:acid stress-induced BolA-like protein IbaG/YrbA